MILTNKKLIVKCAITLGFAYLLYKVYEHNNTKKDDKGDVDDNDGSIFD